jgi:hypothetical protein
MTPARPESSRKLENNNTKGVANDSNTAARIMKIRIMAAKSKK